MQYILIKLLKLNYKAGKCMYKRLLLLFSPNLNQSKSTDYQ